eukprot:SAG11_NODE_31884_length_288_cov_0.825397_1_plen_20_part_01
MPGMMSWWVGATNQLGVGVL